MINPTVLILALPTWIVGIYLVRRMKQMVENEVKKQPVPIPVEAKKREHAK